MIAIGCSAGGLIALTGLLKPISKDFPHPIIIVQHRQKYDSNMLEEVLQHKIKLHVKQADEKEALKNGVVYLAPPDYHLLLERDGSFSLSSDIAINFSRPSIDVFFESVADAYRQNAIGILLTGSNNDGTKGMLNIRKNGGLTIAQDPSTAEYKMMPESAIKNGGALKVMTLDQISNYMQRLK